MEKKYTLKEMHEVFLSMMEEFHDFCVSHNLTYYMVGGTLLGAIREKGFIPWDDDVDFAMPREDYEKFLQIYDGTMQLESYHRDKSFSYPYIKLAHRTMPTIFISDSDFEAEGKVSLNFDIYPIDGVGNTMKQAMKVVKKVNFWKRIYYLNVSKDFSKNPLKAFGVKIIRKVPCKKLVTKIDRAMQKYSYNSSAYVTRWRMPMEKNVVEKVVFGTPVLVCFENMKLYAPNRSEYYLQKVYGDYMKSNREDKNLRHLIE